MYFISVIEIKQKSFHIYKFSSVTAMEYYSLLHWPKFIFSFVSENNCWKKWGGRLESNIFLFATFSYS